MKRLLIVTALLEVGAGALLICCPSVLVELLLGSPLDTSVTFTLGRLAGVALTALAVACWLAHYDTQSCAARGVVSAMAIYNLGAVIVFCAAGICSHTAGVGLWPAAVIHAAMAVWCVTSLLRKPAPVSDSKR